MKVAAIKTPALSLPELYTKIHGTEQEVIVTPAQHALLVLLNQIRLAERSPQQYRKFEAMQRLQREVDWLHDEGEPLPESDPEIVTLARAVVEWIKKQ